jgi:hypothetical protein
MDVGDLTDRETVPVLSKPIHPELLVFEVDRAVRRASGREPASS